MAGTLRPADLSVAHKLLDAVIVVSELEIYQGYKDALSNLDGWSKLANERKGRWYFVGVGSAGESGPAMLRMFREVLNGLSNDKWQSYFVTARELPKLALSARDHVRALLMILPAPARKWSTTGP